MQRSRRYRKNRSVTENEVDGWKAGEKSDVTALVLETASFDSPEPANTRKKNMSSIHVRHFYMIFYTYTIYIYNCYSSTFTILSTLFSLNYLV